MASRFVYPSIGLVTATVTPVVVPDGSLGIGGAINVLPTDSVGDVLDKVVTTTQTTSNAKQGIVDMFTVLPPYTKTGTQFTATMTLAAPLAASVGERVGVWLDGAAGQDNGIYIVTSDNPYTLVRASDSVYLKLGDIVSAVRTGSMYTVSAAPAFVEPTTGASKIDTPGQVVDFDLACGTMPPGVAAIVHGGTGATTATDALLNLAGNSTLADLVAAGFTFSSTGIIAPPTNSITNPNTLTTKAYVDAQAGPTGVVPLSQGGTGATTRQAALAALAGNSTLADLVAAGFAFGSTGIIAPSPVQSSNANSLTTKEYVDASIVAASITGTTGTVPVSRGGTGATTTTNALLALAGNSTLADLVKAGFTFSATGITAPATNTAAGPSTLVTKSYVDTHTGITGTVPVSRGGTGATTTTSALTALAGNSTLADLVKAGFTFSSTGITAPATTAVTSPLNLTTKSYVDTHVGITGTVPVSRGGTGATTTTSALTALAGNSTLADLVKAGFTFSTTGITAPATNTAAGPSTLVTKSYVDTHTGITGTVPVSRGGTGATTTTSALTALAGNSTLADLVKAGFTFSSTGITAPATTAVTSPLNLATKAYVDTHTGITGTVPVSQGGTGATTTTSALTALAGNSTLADLVKAGFTFSSTGIIAPATNASTNPNALVTKAYVDAQAGPTGVVPVSQGGTGMTTGSAALTALAGSSALVDMVASGFTFSSTSITAPATSAVTSPLNLATKAYVDAHAGITGTVAISQGGTGATTAAGALAALAGNSTLSDLASSGFAFNTTGISAPASAVVANPLDITTKEYVDTQILNSTTSTVTVHTDYMPIGSLIYLAYDTTDPTCWMYCNGQSVSRTTYSALFAAIGTMYGSADSGSFNVPDFRGVFMRGLDDGANIDANRQMGAVQPATAIADTIYLREPLESIIKNSDAGEVATISTYIPALAPRTGTTTVNPVEENAAFYKVRPDNIAVKVYIKYADSLESNGFLAINTNSIMSTNANGNILLSPNGTGEAILAYNTPTNPRGIAPKQYVDSRVASAFAKKTTSQAINATSTITFDSGVNTTFATFALSTYTILLASNYKIAVELLVQNIGTLRPMVINICVNGTAMSSSTWQIPNGHSTLNIMDVLSLNVNSTVTVTLSGTGTIALVILAPSRIILNMA